MTPARTSDRAAVVLSLGGSVLFSESNVADRIGQLATLLARVGRRRPLAVTVGGGRVARDYIQLGKELGLTEVELDELGIEVTRLHARLLAARIGPPTPTQPPTTVAQAVHELHRSSPVVLGGTEPGHTTDGVAALLAVRLRAARLVNATNVDGLFTADPRTDPTARLIDRIGWPEFRQQVHGWGATGPGQNFVFDRLGADALSRAGIPLAIVHGGDLKNLEAALVGRTFRGTLVR